MFSMRDFILAGLLDAVGKQPDYWVILNAAGWKEKGILIEDDLAQIQSAIDAHNNPQEPDPLEPMMGIMGKEAVK